MNHSTRTTFVAAVLIAAGAVAFATKAAGNDALSIVNAKIPMTQAIGVAEQHANGNASKAEYERAKAGWVYDVEVFSGRQVFDVKFDATNGAVLSSVAGETDRDDDHDERD
jgi:uncharacterized membrane protein YkoI